MIIILAKPNSTHQRVCNKKTSDLRALKWKKLGKSQNQLFSLVFRSNLAIFHYFVKRFFPLNMALKDGCFVDQSDIF